MYHFPYFVPAQGKISSMLLYANLSHKPGEEVITQYRNRNQSITCIDFSIIFQKHIHTIFPYTRTQQLFFKNRLFTYALMTHAKHGILQLTPWEQDHTGFALVHVLKPQPEAQKLPTAAPAKSAASPAIKTSPITT